MKAEGLGRGESLLTGGARFERSPGLLARVFAPGFHKILDRIDSGLERGSITGHLPDGSTRVLGGRAPGFDAEVTVHDWRALMRLATNGSIGWFQAWEAGEWDSPDPVPLFALFMANGDALGDTGRARGPFRWAARAAHWMNRNTHEGAARNIHVHYDLGNDFYAQWLDPTMSYSSAIWGEGDDLEAAQRRKWERLARRVGDPASVLEIGCGWGGLSHRFAAAGARVVGISLSDEQLAWARERHDPAIDFRHQDYRDVDERFDAIVSVEMVEAVGREYWPSYFDCIARCLKPGGRAAIQFISMKDSLFEAYARSADFIQAYVFPGGLLIRTREFERLARERGLRWADCESFGQDYARTLRTWRARFDRAVEEGRLPAAFDERFRRLWRYYLMYCEGGFRGGGIDVHQVTLIKER
ncbi:SAM-dependent methyltransferase [Pelagerythrobacter marinus]|uniref:Methyltransferase domain-containing protein n=1 Tax=Pelagerythrobacter marinus TaxID=538382 RepID=A0ABW9UVY1_9SPHN|nr:cyclopropane-fatty-acyl-phospholipid synthase family protein [Pelagerythrobacter marinus]MXO67933.1 methyltransferase domain-containing protein [Pelagerythrobacter marinus]USA40899.1 cyclopropane-fatty-acyl-phospholipid synthase family protein [Pelagerythrobacter marinus]WPZ07927.1 cyclopropane-fatty-acyl-phospholipid synthase family protein [Pelagerythrobacter marinus]